MSKIRLKSLDFLKGLAMVAVITAHISFWAGDPNQMFVHGWIWAIFQFCGPAGYAAMTSIGVSLSYLAYKDKTEKKKKSYFKPLLTKAILMYGIGIFFVIDFPAIDSMFSSWSNFIYGINYMLNPVNIFRIHIFQLIAICQLMTYFSLRMKRYYRFLLVIVVILLDIFGYPFVLNMMELQTHVTPENWELFGSSALSSIWGWVYIIVYQNELGMALIPWILIPILTSIAGEMVYFNVIKRVDKDEEELGEEFNEKERELPSLEPKLRPIFNYGLILYFIGILSGLYFVEGFRNRPDLEWINAHEGFPWAASFDKYPIFLFNGSFQSLIYCTGILIFFVGLGLKYNDFRTNKLFNAYKISNKEDLYFTGRFWLFTAEKLTGFISFLEIVGLYSMTAFVMHFILRDFISPLNYPPYIVIPAGFVVTYIVGKIINKWHYYNGGLYTLEFLFNPNIIDKEILKKYKEKQKAKQNAKLKTKSNAKLKTKQK